MVLAIVENIMYGLLQARALANALLKQRLEPHGYFECTHTPGLWRHQTRPIMFALVVDDFGIQYTGKEHAEHLLETLLRDYEAVGVEAFFVESPWIGIMTSDTLPYPCLGMCRPR
jgi:hypothetical protein